jgi:hypothetical protein
MEIVLFIPSIFFLVVGKLYSLREKNDGPLGDALTWQMILTL